MTTPRVARRFAVGPPAPERVVFDVRDYGVVGDGTTNDKAAFIDALDAAEAAGLHNIVHIPAGTRVNVVDGLALAGYSAQIHGAGAGYDGGVARGSAIVATDQAGPVLDFHGWVTPDSAVGRVTPLADLAVAGDGTADPTKANSGVRISSMSSALFRDITIVGTGGPGLDLRPETSGDACYLSDFERITVLTPVGAKANDVPYIRLIEPNCNRFRGLGIRSLSASADCGVSGAVVMLRGTSYTGHDNLFDALWFENLHPPTGGGLFSITGNANMIHDTQFVDIAHETGATGTWFYQLRPPAAHNFGGNIITGHIPGRDTGPNAPQWGVIIDQSNNTIRGTKGYKGYNANLKPGVGRTHVHLTGAYANASDPGIVDESGLSTNTLWDEHGGSAAFAVPIHDAGDPQLLTAGETAWDRRTMAPQSSAHTSGVMALTYLTAKRTETINNVRMYSAGTAAAATPTLVKYGVYEVAANGDLTLVAQTANATGTFAATHTGYTLALTGPWTKTRGQRYAIGVLIVSGAAMPALYGPQTTGTASVVDNVMATAPRWSGQVGGLADLPASAAAGTITATRRHPFAELTP